MKVEVSNTLRMDLVQAQEEIPRNDLNVTKVKWLATRNKVLKQIRWSVRQFNLLLALDLLEHAILLVPLWILA